ATEFNTTIATFPRSLLARACGFQAWPLFEAARAETRAPAMS
ncbi:MAG: LemA family protein, partial [Planctomycetes bacterium]|nr:LemA family protein [Planctomycetota bacterium]